MLNFHKAHPNPDQWETPRCSLCGGTETIVIQENCADTDLTKVECVNCYLRFFSPRPKMSTLEAIGWHFDEAATKLCEDYLKNYGFTYDGAPDAETRKKAIPNFYDGLLQRAAGVSGIAHPSVFEIGGCVGFFLVAAKKRGCTILDGCEVMPAAVRLAREHFGLTGMQTNKFCDYDPGNKAYDLVVMLDFIEHTWTPRLDLEKAFRMTNPGGILLLKTFLEELDLLEGGKMLAPPFHAYHFFGHVLYRMITEAGYIVCDWDISAGSRDQVVVIAQHPEV